MNIKVGDLVINTLEASRVGEYVEKYDVRILPEMITGKKCAEVMYIDEEGAVVTKEFGPYAFPGDALILASEEEKAQYEIDKYTIETDYKGEAVTLPIELGKTLVNDKIISPDFSIRENYDRLANHVCNNWRKISDDVKPILVWKCYDLYKLTVKEGNYRIGWIEELLKLVKNSENDVLINDFKTAFIYTEVLPFKKFYQVVEEIGFLIPLDFASTVKEHTGYVSGLLVEGMDLFDYLKGNRRYDSNFPHYGKLKISKEGLNHIFDLGLDRYDFKNLVCSLNLNINDIRYLLSSPNRAHPLGMDHWFSKLSWEEIIDNKELFTDSLKSKYQIKLRLSKGKYVSPEYAITVFHETSAGVDLILYNPKNKSELKLKEMVSYLDSLSDTDEIMKLSKEIPCFREGGLVESAIAMPAAFGTF